MFISRDEIGQRTGISVDQETLALAQLMIETWVGKSESEVDDASDLEILGRATLFQAIYVSANEDIALSEAAQKSRRVGESTMVLDTEMFSPYMSPWALKACQRLSWMGTRSVHTGPILNRNYALPRWETD